MDNKVLAGFFSFTEVTGSGDHKSYNEWHQFDHMPEQYPLRGIAFGQRWVSTPQCRLLRHRNADFLADIHYVTLYLMMDPLDETLAAFWGLAEHLRGIDRFYPHRKAHLSGAFDLLSACASDRAIISPAAVPYRPNMGVYVFLEQSSDDRRGHWEPHSNEEWLEGQPGIIGAWTFASNSSHAPKGWKVADARITVCFLDLDPLEVARNLNDIIDSRWEGSEHSELVFAGPFETIQPWNWNWFE